MFEDKTPAQPEFMTTEEVSAHAANLDPFVTYPGTPGRVPPACQDRATNDLGARTDPQADRAVSRDRRAVRLNDEANDTRYLWCLLVTICWA